MNCVHLDQLFETQLQAALSLDLNYVDRAHSLDSPAIPASVLLLLGYSRGSALPSVLYIKRTDEVETHKGQVAFPGGHAEPEEQDLPEITALRETEEEVGISRTQIRLFGKLPHLYTPTGFKIQPFVGKLERWIEDVTFVLDEKETREALWIPLEVLVSPGVYRSERIRMGNVDYLIDVYQYRDYRIWGATGSMTKNFIDRLNRVGALINL